MSNFLCFSFGDVSFFCYICRVINLNTYCVMKNTDTILNDSKVRLAVRCIYYKPVTPSCDVIELNQEEYAKFLRMRSMLNRIAFVLKHLDREYMSGKVHEIAWIPLDDDIELIKHYEAKTAKESE